MGTDKNTQIKRMIREMKRRKVRNYEFSQMFILNHTARLTDIRHLGYDLQRDRVYGPDGKATGVHRYWIAKDNNREGMEYEDLPVTNKSNFFKWAMSKLRDSK